MTARERELKIRLLVIVSFLLFFPFTLLSGETLSGGIRTALQEAGWTVLSLDEIPILTPSDGMSFEIRNLSRLYAGRTFLNLTLFHEGERYAETRLAAEIAQAAGPESPVPALPGRRSAALRRDQTDCLIRQGDTIEILYTAGGLVIRAPGRALACARRGEETEALNLVFNTRVRGIAADGRRIILK